VSGYFMLQWPPAHLVAGVIVAAVLLNFRLLSGRKLLFLAGCALGIGVLHFSTLLALLVHAGGSINYVLTSKAGASGPGSVEAWMSVFVHSWREFLLRVLGLHPVAVFMGVGGIACLHDRGLRRWLAPVMIMLAVIAAWGEVWFPRLELARMAIPLMFVAAIPAAVMTGRLLRTGGASGALVRSALIALLVMGGRQAALIYGNRWYGTYTTLSGYVDELSNWIRENVPEDGRVMFAGRTVHFYGGGHVAYLPVLTGREMLACDYYHFPPDSVEYDYPPRAFRETPDGIRRFVDYYNVTHIITYHDSWLEFLGKHTNSCRMVDFRPMEDDYRIFEVHRDSSRFLEGAGSVAADFNRICVNLEQTCDKAVIKYNWVDGMHADAPATVYPVQLENGVQFVGIKPGGARDVVIRYR
jgi:hypothetical protein